MVNIRITLPQTREHHGLEGKEQGDAPLLLAKTVGLGHLLSRLRGEPPFFYRYAGSGRSRTLGFQNIYPRNAVFVISAFCLCFGKVSGRRTRPDRLSASKVRRWKNDEKGTYHQMRFVLGQELHRARIHRIPLRIARGRNRALTPFGFSLPSFKKKQRRLVIRRPVHFFILAGNEQKNRGWPCLRAALSTRDAHLDQLPFPKEQPFEAPPWELNSISSSLARDTVCGGFHRLMNFSKHFCSCAERK